MAGEQKSSAAAAALAREAGQRGVRLVADMDWLRPARAEPAAIAAFEAVLDRLAAELDAMLVCAYRRRSFPAAAIGSALAVHSKTRGHDADPPFQFISVGTRQWRLRGEIDFSVSPLVQAADTAAAQLGDCTVDLHDLKFADLSGMRAIIGTARNATAIELRNPPPTFRR